MRLLRWWRIGLGAAIALSVGVAFATDPTNPYPECNRKPTPADLDGAKGAHKAASQFYDRGDYEKAIRYWTDAYGFDCTAHGVLINIANAYEKKGDKAAAIVALETYLKRAGADATIEEKVKNLKASLPQAATPKPTATATATATPILPTATPTATAPEVPEAPSGPRPYGIAPWIVVGVGGAVAVAGAVLLPVGLSSISKAEDTCGDNHECPAGSESIIEQGNRGRVFAGVGIGAIAVGGAALAGGLVWQFVFNKPKEEAEKPAPTVGVRVLPAIAPGNTGLVITGTF